MDLMELSPSEPAADPAAPADDPCTAETADCTCPDFCERDHGNE
jgi:hypothetical protein